MDSERFAALRTPRGAAALAAAGTVAGGEPLAAAATLRAQGFTPDLAAAALTQAELRRAAVSKFGADAAGMFFTRAGLEQATRSVVATRRADRLRSAGIRTLADLGCGIGADALAAARAGMRVYAVESDPLTAEVARANAAALGLTARITVVHGDARDASTSDVDAVFCDPARRGRDGRRVFDPDAYSPPWPWLMALVDRVPRTALKLAPGIDHDLIPPGAEAEWVSVGGDLVEATFWCGPLARVPRRATLLSRDATPASRTPELTGSGLTAAPVGPVGRYVYDPDPAVVRAHLVAEFAAALGGRLGDPAIAYVYADAARATPFGRVLEVLEVMPFSLKRLRALLRDRRVGRVEILKRGSPLDPQRLRRDLRLRGDRAVSIVLTRLAGAPTVLLCRPL